MRSVHEPQPGLEPSSHRDTSDAPAAAGLSGSLKAHPLLIAVLTLLVALAALAWSSARAPTYEASAQILVTPLPEAGGSDPRLPVLRTSSDRTRVVQTAANLLDSPAAASTAAKRLGQGWTAARVDSMVDVLPEGQSDVLSVTAKANDAALAARVANEYARSALEARGRALAPVVASLTSQTARELAAEPNSRSPVALSLAQRLSDLRALGTGVDPTLSLTRPAELPTSEVGASPALLAIVGLLAGLAVGIGSALVLDMLGPPRLGNAEQAIATTGLPVLARVPGLGRARPSSTVRFRPGAAAPLRTMQHQLEFEPGTRRQILLTGASSGDGVTTCVAELGLTLARAGHDVLLVDLDTRKPQLAGRLGLTEREVPTDERAGQEGWDGALAAVPAAANLKVATVGAYGAMGMPDEVAAEFPMVLEQLRRHFDYVLIDAPPLAESGEALRVAGAVDAVVLVLCPGRTPMPDLETALDLLGRASKRPEGLVLVGGRATVPPPDAAAADRRSEHAPGAARPLGRSA
jgi:Mrp family chromosome partitioning ATPase/capsular polysaccharide biosynthesis protein